ncbi:MAG: ATP-grasp domain-containing protein [Ignavibacteriaceae bacterium]|jgi:D-alanine-D-alanine ligase
MKKKQTVAVIYNEPSPELYVKRDVPNLEKLNFIPYFEIEDKTPMEEYEVFAQKIEARGYNCYTLNLMDDFHLLINRLTEDRPDVIFNFVELFHNNPKLEMNVTGIFELLEIPFTGAPPLALANCQSKVFTKRMLSSYGIATPEFQLIKTFSEKYKHSLRFPIIVKPAFEDASVGIDYNAVVHNKAELNAKINYIFGEFKQAALIEEFIDGRELNVAVMGDENPVVLPISEIDFSAMPDHFPNIVSYQAKWDPLHEAYHKTIPICPSILPKKIQAKAEKIALTAFKAMGVRDYARIDMRLSKDNELFVLEVNPNPDLTEGAGFMRSVEAAGIEYDEMLEKIIQFALLRGEKYKNHGKVIKKPSKKN